MSIKQGELKIFSGTGCQLVSYLEVFDQYFLEAGNNPFPWSTLEETQLEPVEIDSALQLSGFSGPNGLETDFVRSAYSHESLDTELENSEGFLQLVYQDVNARSLGVLSNGNPAYSVCIMIEFEEFPKVDSE
jgi:hypothetical protein